MIPLSGFFFTHTQSHFYRLLLLIFYWPFIPLEYHKNVKLLFLILINDEETTISGRKSGTKRNSNKKKKTKCNSMEEKENWQWTREMQIIHVQRKKGYSSRLCLSLKFHSFSIFPFFLFFSFRNYESVF